jgi:hypothetical protein
MRVQFVIDEETFFIPMSALAIPNLIHSGREETNRPDFHFNAPRRSKNPRLIFPDTTDSTQYTLLDGTADHILEVLYDHKFRAFIIKAHYPGFAPYMKKFEFREYFLALQFWEEFTFLYYHRFENWDLKESVRKSKAHRLILRNPRVILR